MEGLFRKVDYLQGSGLHPATEEAQHMLAELPKYDDVLVTVKTGRSVKNHRRLFSFFKMTFDWQDEYENFDIWRRVLTLKAGHFLTVVDKKGNTQFWPLSISFRELDDEQKFKKLFNEIVRVYLKDFGGNLSQDQINQANSY